MAGEREVEPVLQRLVHAARELGGARYAALGVPDGEGAFARFITSGMSEALIEAMGPLPRTHGLLGAMLESPEPYRIDDIHTRPALPRLVAVGAPGHALVPRRPGGGARAGDRRRLPDRQADAPSFSDDDERLIGLLAAHAAIAIENARLYERSRELSIVEERNRLARELHDSVIQRLFGVSLAIESAGTLLERDPAAAAGEVERVRELSREAMEELRAVVFELRPASLEAEGLASVLRKHVDVLRRVSSQPIELTLGDPPRLPRRAGGAGVPDRAGGAPERAAPRRRRAHRGAARERRRRARAERGRRRARLRPDRARGARAPARPDLDGGARGGARRDARRSESVEGEGTRVRLEVAGVIRVLIADDHAVVRQGLRTFLDLQDDVEVVGEAADGEAAVAEAWRAAPDVVLLDLAMPLLDGVAALPRLREAAPAARVIVLTSFGEDERLFAALRAGAAGFLLKDVEPAELVQRDPHRPRGPGAALARRRRAHGRGDRARRRPRAAGRRADPARARGAAADRGRALEQADRARARGGGEDGQDPRLPRARQARPLRPHAGGAVRGARRDRRPGVLEEPNSRWWRGRCGPRF